MTEKVVFVTTEGDVSTHDLEVNGTLFDGLKELIGGWIEMVRPVGLKPPFVMIVDEDGLMKELDNNFFGSMLYGTIAHGHPIVGNIVIAKQGYRNGEPDILGLTDEEASYIVEIASTYCGSIPKN